MIRAVGNKRVSKNLTVCIVLLAVLFWFETVTARSLYNAPENIPLQSSAGSSWNPPSPNSGPTIVVKIIDPDNGPGADYTSLDDFAQNEKRDLVSANEIAVALCRSSNGSPDGPAQFYDWITDEEHYVKIVADDAHRATAKWDDSKYRIIEHTTINSECIDIEVDNIVIDGIQMRLTGSGQNNDVLDPEAGDKYIIKNCFIWLDLSNGSGSGIDPKSEVEIYNCIFKGSHGSGILAKQGANIKAHNNTFIGWVHAISTEGTVSAVNNISRDASGTAYIASGGGVFTSVSDYNSAENSGETIVKPPRNNTQSPWYSGATPDKDIFIDADNNDYHLKPNTIFGRKGIGPGANPAVADHDIDLESRSGPSTDLGADFEPSPVGIYDNTPEIPQSVILYPNYPNPFNPSTNLRFRISEFGFVKLEIFDISGQKTATLVSKELPAGEYTIQWDGFSDNGKSVASGIYFARLIAKQTTYIKKMQLLR